MAASNVLSHQNHCLKKHLRKFHTLFQHLNVFVQSVYFGDGNMHLSSGQASSEVKGHLHKGELLRKDNPLQTNQEGCAGSGCFQIPQGAETLGLNVKEDGF